MFIKAKQLYFTNCFFAAAPNNKKIKGYIDTVLKNIEGGRSDLDVWYLTGPGVM